MLLDYALLPPEINSLRMYTGPGASSLMAAAQSWTTTASSLTQAAQQWSSTITTLTDVWSGPSSVAMTAAATLYQSWVMLMATQCEQTAAQALSAVEAYESAFAMTVPPAVVAANRTLLAMLVSTNFLGVNAPAIMDTEAHYTQMWAQDAEAMFQYTASSLQDMVLEPFTPAPQVVTLLNAVTPSVVGLGDIFAPGSNQSTTGLAGLLNLLSGSTGSSFGTLINSNFVSTGLINSLWSSGFYMPSQSILPLLALFGLTGSQSSSPSSSSVPTNAAGVPEVPWLGTPTQAAVGQGSNIGPLSVPASWGQAAHNVKASAAATIPIARNGSDGNPGFPGVPLARAAGNSGSTSALPKYGSRPTIISRPPSGG
jgi:PPE-repeat protein